MEVDNIEVAEVNSPLTFDDFKKKVYMLFSLCAIVFEFNNFNP